MDLSEQIVAALREKYQSGATFAELSEQTGVSASYIRHIMNGKRDPMKISVDFLLRLFPTARIMLSEDTEDSTESKNAVYDETLFTREIRTLQTRIEFMEFEVKNKEDLICALQAHIRDLERLLDVSSSPRSTLKPSSFTLPQTEAESEVAK